VAVAGGAGAEPGGAPRVVTAGPSTKAKRCDNDDDDGGHTVRRRDFGGHGGAVYNLNSVYP
jgi:hypothetical protein